MQVYESHDAMRKLLKQLQRLQPVVTQLRDFAQQGTLPEALDEELTLHVAYSLIRNFISYTRSLSSNEFHPPKIVLGLLGRALKRPFFKNFKTGSNLQFAVG